MRAAGKLVAEGIWQFCSRAGVPKEGVRHAQPPAHLLMWQQLQSHSFFLNSLTCEFVAQWQYHFR